MSFDKRISLGNILTIVGLIVAIVAQTTTHSKQWGAYLKQQEAMEKRLEAVEAAQAEYRRDTRVVEALQRVAVIENNVIWIRSDVTEIKQQLNKKGAE